MSLQLTRRSLALLPLLGIVRARQIVAAEAASVIASSQGAVELSNVETRVALLPRDPAVLRQRLASLSADQQVLLVLRDIHAAAQPGVVYRVYLGLPSGASAARTTAQPVGLLNFFAFAAPNPRRDMSRSYDVTQTIKQLVAQDLLPDRIAVTFVADGDGTPAANAHASIGAIDLIIE